MCNITHYQGNVNHNYKDLPEAIIQKSTSTDFGDGMVKKISTMPCVGM